jgi:2'-5' RNA ligase
MNVFAALVPPPEVVGRVQELVAGLARTSEGAPTSRPSRQGLLGRRRRHQVAAAPAKPQLDFVPAHALHLPIARFGNLPLSEASRLAEAVDEAASEWESPRLHLAGGLALEPEGDSSVWLKLAGDLDALGTIGRGVPAVAKKLQLFVDRRGFRPHIRIADVNDLTTETYLAQVLAALEEFESPSWWQTNVLLMNPADQGPHQPPFKPFREATLGPAVPH